MTRHEIGLARALDGCGYVGGRFMRDIAFAANNSPERELTLRQRHYMEILAWRYRRQLPAHLVPDAKPVAMPARRKPPKPEPKPNPQLEIFDTRSIQFGGFTLTTTFGRINYMLVRLTHTIAKTH